MMDWDKAYRAHHAEVFAHLYKRTGHNKELARDLMQDVFVRAIRCEHQFTDRGHGLMPWLTTIAQNLLADHRKRRSTSEVLTAEFGDDELRLVASAEADAMTALRTAAVRRAVAGLDPEPREAIVLSYWGGWPDEEIAEGSGVTARTVNTRRWRARQLLRRELAGVA